MPKERQHAFDNNRVKYLVLLILVSVISQSACNPRRHAPPTDPTDQYTSCPAVMCPYLLGTYTIVDATTNEPVNLSGMLILYAQDSDTILVEYQLDGHQVINESIVVAQGTTPLVVEQTVAFRVEIQAEGFEHFEADYTLGLNPKHTPCDCATSYESIVIGLTPLETL